MKSFFGILLILITVYGANAQKTSVECVRSVPVPILKKSVFPKKTFNLTKSKENPGEMIGYEKVKVNKGSDLTIVNAGCENYTLTFQFLVKNQNRPTTDTKFWYKTAIELMNSIKKGIRSVDLDLINRGLRAVTTYLHKTKKPKFENYLEFGGTDIRDTVVLDKVSQQAGKHKVAISFSVGPL